ncbi:hypothetical protein BUALT_Bualt16G0021500 [Buddleja alternifolia]|uniref:Glycosyltransferase n=1 Tax=Buddleja alternifolia TaxID=168488 RepID=A0AAV6W8Z7_9LAMI|nr:hypothetical protein BUALT_Bualt16G0021500 [Buddleja alternifolia]
MGKPHAIMVPFPMQGHIIPLMELAQCLAKHGIRVTFVNTEINHDRIQALSGKEVLNDRICLVSVPDGLESRERYIPGKLMETVYEIMPGNIEELIQEINASNEDKITCVIYDQCLARIQEVAEKLGVGSAAFCAAAAALLVLGFNIPRLIEDGIIDNEGSPLSNNNNIVQFNPTMPIISPSDFVWNRSKISALQKLVFNIMKQNNKFMKSANWLICNSVHDLEPGAFAVATNITPIGPLLSTNRPGNLPDHIHEPDSDCLKWLDQQPPCSVIYIAFGSTTIFNKNQFQELAMGIEQSNRSFLWVVRPDSDKDFPDGYSDRVTTRGRIVGWAPQQRVLSHSSIACFISHCGWNSTLESVSSGVPMLCWPYFADQFINRSYICDSWKIGLTVDEDENGIVKFDEIKAKIDRLFEEDVFKERTLCLKEMISSSASEGGDSYKNLSSFISWIRG